MPVPRRRELLDVALLVHHLLRPPGPQVEPVDGRHLARPVAVLQLAVLRAVVPGHHPRRQVVLLARRERCHLDVLLFGFTRQPHDHVPQVGVARRAVGRRRDLPLILAVEEDHRFVHVVRRVERRLYAEQVLGIPDVRP